MYKIAVLGGGMMAQGVAEYFRKNILVKEFVCYDISADNLQKLKPYLGSKGSVVLLNLTNSEKLLHTFRTGNFDGIINTLPDKLIPETTLTCISSGLSMVSLVGNDIARKEQEKLHNMAVLTNSIIVPACGLAPGIISDLAYWGKNKVASAHTIKMFCGGLMQQPTGELKQAAFFNADSLDGLYDEYVYPPWIIENGEVSVLPYLFPKENVKFNNPLFSAILESALTHGAFEADPNFWKIHNIFYATLRYSGHYKRVREAIRKKTRRNCIEWLKDNLSHAGEDLVVLRVEIFGENEIFTCELIDFFDKNSGLSAMKRCTGFPAAETLLQTIQNKNWPIGVARHEKYIDMQKMIANLAFYGIKIRTYGSKKGNIIT